MEDYSKSGSALDIVSDFTKEELEKSRLNTGYDFSNNLWEIIVKYNGDLNEIAEKEQIAVEILSSNYAIMTLSFDKIKSLLNYRQIEYIEKPRLLELFLNNSLNNSCISQVKSTNSENLTGKGVVVAILDSGIDITHPDFRNNDGTTRIIALWDQTVDGTPPKGFLNGMEYTSREINDILNTPEANFVSQDYLGHGTHVAGIAAGNGRKSNGLYSGIASESSIIVVKLGEKGRESFARTTEIMRAIKYVIDKSIEFNMPVAINISYGTNDGSHSGDSLFETYINDMSNIWKCSICVASGNEGSDGHHYSAKIRSGEEKTAEFIIESRTSSILISLWKNFVDIFNFEIIAPNNQSSGIIGYTAETVKYNLQGNTVFVNIGTPTPYSINQQVFFEIIANENYVSDGLWKINVYGIDVIDGEYNIWLPVTEAVSRDTFFLNPDIYTTLTIPSTAQNVITVGGYNSLTDSISDFSGRGYTRKYKIVKPDIVAPAYNITSTIPGGYDSMTGTSMATPHVTGSAALLMEWGIVRKNDPFLYGQRLKAYLRIGAKRQDNISYPNREWGYGALCLSDTISALKRTSIFSIQQTNNNNNNNDYSKKDVEDAVYSEDYKDILIELIANNQSILDDYPELKYCKCIKDTFIVAHIKKELYNQFIEKASGKLIMQEPFLMGLMDTSALSASGILTVQNQPYLSLKGNNVMVGIVDTGIDYTNKAFIYEDGTSKIHSIWDQSIMGNPPKEQCYGTEYKNEQINEALKSENPFDVVPTRDEIGHGTFLASISAGRAVPENDFIGAAPDAELIVVKLKEAKNNLKQSKAMLKDVPAYSEGDLMLGINYLISKAAELKKPISICVGLGTNEGSHAGSSIIENFIASNSVDIGVTICEAVGNEGNAKHHIIKTISHTNEEEDIELRVGENETGFLLNFWTFIPDKISISILSPLGEEIRRVQPIINSTQRIRLNLGNTEITIQYLQPILQGLGEQIKILFERPSAGIWKITLYGDSITNGVVHGWLPIKQFLNDDTFFLSSDPYYTTVVPATGRSIISVGGYNHLDESIYVETGRGPNRINLLSPFFVAPAVNVYGATLTGFGIMSGTSVAAAITAGACALLLEWGIVKGNDPNINTVIATSYLIRGAIKSQNEIYPNNIWGYGMINLYNSFRSIL